MTEPRMRQSRKLRVLRYAPRVEEMSFESLHPRSVPAIRHNHRIERRPR